MSKDKKLRSHLLELLDGAQAHIDLRSALEDFPKDKINLRVRNSLHTAWELLEHLRIAQWDIVQFSRSKKHASPEFPDGYWPTEKGTHEGWDASVKQIFRDLKKMRKLIADEKNDLYAKIPHGSGQTLLREALVLADHNSYTLGQLMMLRKMLSK